MPEIKPDTDPVDQAYAAAEAILDDNDARAARRARVLAAVAQADLSPTSNASRPAHRTAWRRGGWLVAASVAGFGLFWAADQSIQRQAPTGAKTKTKPTTDAVGAPPAPPRPNSTIQTVASPPALATRRASAAYRVSKHPPPIQPRPTAIPPPDIAMPALPIPPIRNPQPESIGPPQPVPPSPPAPPAPPAAPPPVSALAGRSSATAFPGSQTESAAKLRAAAAAGRIEDIGTLLAQGVPVDAADAKGDTALMESIQADQPAVAALLYQRGANLDQRNLAGLSARDMAKAKDDRVLDQALGLGP